jgi:hypothetical protein
VATVWEQGNLQNWRKEEKMKKRILMAVSISAILVLSLAGSVYAAAASLSNPGFETGDTTGWTETIPSGGSINVVTSYVTDLSNTWTAKDGDYFAVLKTDGAGSSTALSQSVTVMNGDTISGWAFFDARDGLPWDDDAAVVILDETLAIVDVPFYADVEMVGNYGDKPWTAWSYTFTADGTYTVEARITNYGDDLGDSRMGFDIDFMPAVSTSLLSGPATVEVGELASWDIEVTICPHEDYGSDDVIVQGGIGSDLVVTEVLVDGTPYYPTVPGGSGWVQNPDKKWEMTYACGDVTLRTNGKSNKASATVATWDVGDLDAGEACQSIVITFETGLNPKGYHEFTSPDELGHELDGGLSATFWYDDVEYETPETEPWTVIVTGDED